MVLCEFIGLLSLETAFSSFVHLNPFALCEGFYRMLFEESLGHVRAAWPSYSRAAPPTYGLSSATASRSSSSFSKSQGSDGSCCTKPSLEAAFCQHPAKKCAFHGNLGIPVSTGQLGSDLCPPITLPGINSRPANGNRSRLLVGWGSCQDTSPDTAIKVHGTKALLSTSNIPI